MEERQPYNLYDDDGRVYTAYVTRRDAEMYDLDHKRRFRLIRDLKAKNAPSDVWMDLSNNSTSGDHEVSVWEPPVAKKGTNRPLASSTPAPTGPSRATGKTGANWLHKEHVIKFLELCLPHRSELQKRYVNEAVYQNISDELFCLDMDYSSGQLRSKMKSLKRTFMEAKSGKHSGSSWPFFSLMSNLFSEGEDATEIATSTIQPPKQHDEHRASPRGINENLTYVLKSKENEDPTNVTYDVFPEVIVNDSEDPKYVTYVVSSELNGKENNIVKVCDLNQNETDAVWPDSNIHSTEWDDTVFHENVQISPEGDPESGSHMQGNQSVDGGVLNELCSPNRKKRIGPCIMTPKGRSSPRKTPNRKIPQSSLVWPQNIVKDFLDECLKVKNILNDKDAFIPLAVWKDMAEKLNKLGHSKINWELCRAKFENLSSFYWGTLVKVNGVLGGIRVPHYNIFMQVFDKETQTDDDILWTKENTKLLIGLYKDNFEVLENKAYPARHELIYNSMVEAFSWYNVEVTAQQCRGKMGRLKMYFREEFDKGAKTGGALSTWPFYEEMLDMFGDSPTLNAPFVVSAGTEHKYTAQGEELEKRTTGTRTRPKSAASSSKPKQVSHRSWTQGMQEMKAAQGQDLVTEIRMWRESQTTRQEIHTSLLERMVNKMCSNS